MPSDNEIKLDPHVVVQKIEESAREDGLDLCRSDLLYDYLDRSSWQTYIGHELTYSWPLIGHNCLSGLQGFQADI